MRPDRAFPLQREPVPSWCGRRAGAPQARPSWSELDATTKGSSSWSRSATHRSRDEFGDQPRDVRRHRIATAPEPGAADQHHREHDATATTEPPSAATIRRDRRPGGRWRRPVRSWPTSGQLACSPPIAGYSSNSSSILRSARRRAFASAPERRISNTASSSAATGSATACSSSAASRCTPLRRLARRDLRPIWARHAPWGRGR